MNRAKKLSPQVKISAVYIGIATAWILLSDIFVESLVGDLAHVTFYQTVKGILYVLTTGLLLYFLVRNNFERIIRSKNDLKESYDTTVQGWVRYLDLRDNETHDHTERVAEVTVHLAEKMGLRGETLVHIRRGALLHDIGKIGIPDSILGKKGFFGRTDREIVEQHPRLAYDFLNRIKYLRPALDIPYCHHEKWDGTGYPRRLKGKQIPLSARIFTIVDVWDALSFDRVYRKAWPQHKVLEYIRNQSGKHFDPEIVELFIQDLPYLRTCLCSGRCAPASRPQAAPEEEECGQECQYRVA